MSFLGYIDRLPALFAKINNYQDADSTYDHGAWSVKIGDTTYSSRLNIKTTEDLLGILRLRVFSAVKRPIVQHLRCIIEEGDAVMEVGAFEGLYALKLAELVGSTGRVYTSELIPEHAETMRYNFAQNRVSGAVVDRGVSPQGGDVEVYSGGNQLNGLKSDVIGRYVNAEQITKRSLKTMTLDQVFDHLQIETPIKFLILQINGIESEVIKSFNRFSLVDNMCIAMKYTDRAQIIGMMRFLGQRGYRSEFHQAFLYSQRSSKPRILLEHPVWFATERSPSGQPLPTLDPKLTQALLTLIVQLNDPSNHYNTLGIESVVELCRVGESLYPETFPSLEVIDSAVFPYDLFALVCNHIGGPNHGIQVVIKPEDIHIFAYLALNLNLVSDQLNVKHNFDETFNITDRNAQLLFRPDLPR